MAKSDVHIVFLETAVVLVKRPGIADWRVLQDEFADYRTSLGPMTVEEAADYLDIEYGADAGRTARVRAFATTSETILSV